MTQEIITTDARILDDHEARVLLRWRDMTDEHLVDGMSMQQLLDLYHASAEYVSIEGWLEEDPKAPARFNEIKGAEPPNDFSLSEQERRTLTGALSMISGSHLTVSSQKEIDTLRAKLLVGGRPPGAEKPKETTEGLCYILLSTSQTRPDITDPDKMMMIGVWPDRHDAQRIANRVCRTKNFIIFEAKPSIYRLD